ncbi:MAG: type II secretion system protein GspL [Sphingomonadaceae bacterium]
MSEALILLLGEPLRWLRIADGAIIDRGQGTIGAHGDARVVAIVPAADVAIHRGDLPDLSEAQARAAARLLIAEQSAASIDSLHVAIGTPDGDGGRTLVAIDSGRMAAWLTAAAGHGFDPDVMLAAPLLLPRPVSGYVKGDIGPETVVRGADSAFVDDPVLTPLVTGGTERRLDAAEVEAAVVAAIAHPEVDLRQGPFAKRRSWGLDRSRLRRIGALAAVLLGIVLLTQIVQLIRLDGAARSLEDKNKVLARAALPPGTNVNDPVLQLREALAARQGPGGGLLPLASAIAGAIEATPNAELGALVFDGGGTLRATIRATTPADLAALDARLAALGLAVAPGTTMVDQGKQVRDTTVSAR